MAEYLTKNFFGDELLFDQKLMLCAVAVLVTLDINVLNTCQPAVTTVLVNKIFFIIHIIKETITAFIWLSNKTAGAASAGKHESWEFDSGARDLSPEPHSLQKLVEAAGGSTSSGNLLQLANKVSTV